jgi:hypothetical protein
VALALVAAGAAGLAGGGAAGTAFAPKPLSGEAMTHAITVAVESAIKPLTNRVSELERRAEVDRLRSASFEAEWRAQITAFQHTQAEAVRKLAQVAETISKIEGILDEMRRRPQ